MATRLSNVDDVRKALFESQGRPIEVEDDESHTVYVLIARDQFQDMQLRVIEDGELSEAEMLSVAAQSLNDPEGWGAPGMDEYDQDATESGT